MTDKFEVAIFTASMSDYADQIIDELEKLVSYKFFWFYWEDCTFNGTNYIKDLEMLGRPLSDVIIVDNLPWSYLFHPSNGIPIDSWFFE